VSELPGVRRSVARTRSPRSAACGVSGRLAWCIWLVVHLGYLVGFENRTLVLLRWS
jgi:NADH dehydrogenase FAD-containing subunit